MALFRVAREFGVAGHRRQEGARVDRHGHERAASVVHACDRAALCEDRDRPNSAGYRIHDGWVYTKAAGAARHDCELPRAPTELSSPVGELSVALLEFPTLSFRDFLLAKPDGMSSGLRVTSLAR